MRQTPTDQFDAILESTSGAMARLALGITRDPQLAQDACQEAYLALLRALRKSASITNHEAWLRRVVVRKAIALLMGRRGADGHRVPLEAAYGTCSSTRKDSLGAELREAISQLPRELRDAVTLRFFHGCTGHEIAEGQGCAERTAQRRVQDGIRALRRVLSDGNRNPGIGKS